MITQDNIKKFFSANRFAIIGVSRNPKHFSHHIYAELKNKVMDLVPVNPNASEINGDKCYTSIEQLPQEINTAIIVTNKNNTHVVLQELLDRGFENIWIQRQAESEESVKLAKIANTNIIYKQCILMYAEPVVSIHKVHRVIARIFGQVPSKNAILSTENK